MASRWKSIVLLVGVFVPSLAYLSEIRGLKGQSDYRQIFVSWEYPTKVWFQLHYCEVQEWGPSRCKAKVVDAESGRDQNGSVQYSTTLKELRMATNYSIRVEEGRRTRRLTTPTTITVPTKGFSARAVSCLPEVSEVEVQTGPYFSGRIGVESGPCFVEGQPDSPRDIYLLRIDHTLCGSLHNATSVSTYVLVQESSHILTHSTRRFLVLCTFHPETLTVRAGLNLPHTGDGMVAPSFGEISGNEVHAAPLRQAGPANGEDNYNYDAILGAIGVAMGLIAVGLALWRYFPSRIFSVGEEERRVYDNLESCSGDGTNTETVQNSVVSEESTQPADTATENTAVTT